MAKKTAPSIRKIPEPLLHYVKDGKCVLFAGSGLSACAKLPTWERLIQSMLEKLHHEKLDTNHMRELNRLFQAKKFTELAAYCKEKLHDKLYSQVLVPQLRGDMVDIPEHHKIIMHLPFAGIVTTNYDKLLERAYVNEGGNLGWPITPTQLKLEKYGSLLFENKTYIIKAHGDIDDEDSVVLTASDYSRIIHNNPAFHTFFSAILLTKAILFIGYSITDPDFRLLLDHQFTIFRGRIPARYALMSKVDEVERDILMQTAGIEVIPYKEHSEVLEFLQALQDAIIPV